MGLPESIKLIVSVFLLESLLLLKVYLFSGRVLPLKADSWYYLGNLDMILYFIILYSILLLCLILLLYFLLYYYKKEYSILYCFLILFFPYIFMETTILYFDTPIMIYLFVVLFCIVILLSPIKLPIIILLGIVLDLFWGSAFYLLFMFLVAYITWKLEKVILS